MPNVIARGSEPCYRSIVPRYYFHASGPTRYVADTKGIELDNIQAAYDLAIQIIRDTMGDRLGFPEAGDWTIKIADQDSQTALTVPFVDALRPASEQN